MCVSPSLALGKYELLEQIGHGGIGAVFRARDTELDRIVELTITGTGQVSARPERTETLHAQPPQTYGATHVPPQRQKGKLRRLFRELLGQSDDAAEQVSNDLTAYRRRAAELLERLRQSTAADTTGKRTALGILAERLSALIEDLQSVGAPAAEIDPLLDLLRRLREMLADIQPYDSEITGLWSDATRLLQVFAGSLSSGTCAGTVDSGRCERFWK